MPIPLNPRPGIAVLNPPRPVSQDVLRLAVQILTDQAPAAISKLALARKLGVTKRTVEGALNALADQGAEFETGWAQEGSGRVKTWRLQRRPDWDETLDSGARLAMNVVLSALGNGLAGAWRAHLEEIQSLVEGKLSAKELKTFDKLKGRILIQGARRSRPPRPGVLDAVLGCLGGPAQRKLSLRYASAATGREEQITVIPWCLLHDVFSSGAFLLCWDLNRENPGLLRLNRILAAAEAGPGALTAAERDLLDQCGRYQIGGFIATGNPEELQVRVSGKLWVRAFLEQPPGLPEVSVTEEPGGTVLVRFRASEYQAPARWVLQMGPDAEAISPVPFRAFVASRAGGTAAIYEPSSSGRT